MSPTRWRTPTLSRRDFMKLCAAGGAGAVGARLVPFGGGGGRAGASTALAKPKAAPRPPTPLVPGASKDRSLVVVELQGGNDGLSMLVPYGLGAYYDLRRRTAVPPEEVLALDATVGLNKNLSRLAKRGVAVVQGVGVPHPDGSHFAMMARWWAGDEEGRGTFAAGFLGRLCDAIGDPDAPAVGIGLAGSTPALTADRVTTVALDDPGSASFLTEDDRGAYDAFQAGIHLMGIGAAGDADAMLAARRGMSDAERLARLMDRLPDDGSGDDRYPGSNLGRQLRIAAELLGSGAGVRVIHTQADGSYDTHDNHRDQYTQLAGGIDEALDAFLADLAERGIADRVLVATTSEFGRRVADNGSDGLDHGAASIALLAGPVTAGLHGSLPSLTATNDDGNLMATVSMGEYYATIAEGWLGVPASEVLDGDPKPIPGIFAPARAGTVTAA